MRETLVSVCRSPCCYARLSADIAERKGAILWRGLFVCQVCGRRFPLQDGIAYLAVLDATWSYILKELVNRRKIVERELEGAEQETGKAELKQCQHDIAEDVMETLFEEALKEIPFERGVRVLDVGAGWCKTSAVLADRGAEVVATETEIANLQYVSFEETDAAETESLEVRGKLYYRKNPERAKRYFTRVLSNGERLPFESEAFDVVFCRSVMHHVKDMRGVLREMLRVVRVGGNIVMCSEPIRSILDREEPHVRDNVDKIEGMNERRPTLADYVVPLLGRTRGITVQYWQSPFIDRSRRFFELVGYNYMKHLRQGERVQGVRLVKLLPVSASVNVSAEKTGHRAEAPKWKRGRTTGVDVARLLELYTYTDLEEERREFRRKTGLLLSLRRETLALREHIGSGCFPGRCHIAELEKGWLEKAKIGGKWGRFTSGIAEVILKRRGTEEALELRVAAPRNGVTNTAGVRVNGTEVGTISVSGQREQRFVLHIGAISERILDVEMENDMSNRDNEQGTQKEPLPGIWVYSIKIL